MQNQTSANKNRTRIPACQPWILVVCKVPAIRKRRRETFQRVLANRGDGIHGICRAAQNCLHFVESHPPTGDFVRNVTCLPLDSKNLSCDHHTFDEGRKGGSFFTLHVITRALNAKITSLLRGRSSNTLMGHRN